MILGKLMPTAGITMKTALDACFEFNELGTAANIVDSYNGLAVPANTYTPYLLQQPGIMGYAMNMEGTGPLGNIGLRFSGETELSMSVWFKVSNPPNVTSMQELFNINTKLMLEVQNTSFPLKYRVLFSGNSSIYVTDNSYSIPANTWNHVVMTWSAASKLAKLYRNGVRVLSYAGGSSTATYLTSSNAYLALKREGTSLSGTIDQLAWWKRELTPQEVTALYNSGNGLPYTQWT